MSRGFNMTWELHAYTSQIEPHKNLREKSKSVCHINSEVDS